MKNNTIYRCAICGKEYADIRERISCETDCLKKRDEENKKAEEAKKLAEKNARHKEVNDAFDNAYKLLNQYTKDYGHYTYNGNIKDLNLLNMDCFPIKLWHHFWD